MRSLSSHQWHIQQPGLGMLELCLESFGMEYRPSDTTAPFMGDPTW